MEMEKLIKESFCVIGKLGSTNDGPGFFKALWEDANAHFTEVKDLSKRDESGMFSGFFGAMSDFSMSFKPWENNFSQGLYLAGVESRGDAQAPNGWTKWVIPGFEYIKVQVTDASIFPKTIKYLNENNLKLVGAVQDFTDPRTGNNYMLFPIRKL